MTYDKNSLSINFLLQNVDLLLDQHLGRRQEFSLQLGYHGGVEEES